MRRMRWIILSLVLGAACGGAGSPNVVGPPTVAWDDMTTPQRREFMAKVVVPTMKPIFQTFDATRFASFGCPTCHGDGAKQQTFKMPNPDIFVLPNDDSSAGFDALFETNPRWMRFMARRVAPAMTKLLDKPAYDSTHPTPTRSGAMAVTRTARHPQLRAADYLIESRPFWKRPACERSARARVSNHSAISVKPSSRAVFAKPGYIVVYS